MARAQAGNQVIWNGLSGTTPTSQILGDGSATFEKAIACKDGIRSGPDYSTGAAVITWQGDATNGQGQLKLTKFGTGTTANLIETSDQCFLVGNDGSASFGGVSIGSAADTGTQIYKDLGQVIVSSTDTNGIKIYKSGVDDPGVVLNPNGTATFAGGVTVDGSRPLMIGTGADEIDVKDKLNKMTSALEGLRDAASTSETLTDLKIAIVTALSQFQ